MLQQHSRYVASTIKTSCKDTSLKLLLIPSRSTLSLWCCWAAQQFHSPILQPVPVLEASHPEGHPRTAHVVLFHRTRSSLFSRRRHVNPSHQEGQRQAGAPLSSTEPLEALLDQISLALID
uniref:Uncharacterized protein n=1 Tax=Eutreptiella gymnastica TaxID=73025 RepID=A0A6U8FHC2_9EUGL